MYFVLHKDMEKVVVFKFLIFAILLMAGRVVSLKSELATGKEAQLHLAFQILAMRLEILTYALLPPAQLLKIVGNIVGPIALIVCHGLMYVVVGKQGSFQQLDHGLLLQFG
ncbi:unnamed protein product [Lactuca saligna]|uniref:Uncharacterized protein n=1 Tax=Lactuca saligna TaxID=75948 RepID=A0AA35ZFY3_LACSI|nr:unnamed protein product [Lactuca saligna]